MFEQSFVDREGKHISIWAMMASSLGQILLIVVMCVIPLLFSDTLPGVLLAKVFAAPQPPPPQQMATVAPPAVSNPRPFQDADRLLAPGKIPSEISFITDVPDQNAWSGPYMDYRSPLTREIPNMEMAAIIGYTPPVAAPPPAPPKPTVRRAPRVVKVGGDVRPPVLLQNVKPVYPELARQVRVSGLVRLQAVIAIDGKIKNLNVVSGHPLLRPAALAAVREWVYAPTLLNGEPVEVALQIDVNFRLDR